MLDHAISWAMRLLGSNKLPLVDLAQYRKPARMDLCGGVDPLEVVVAYAQDSLVYTQNNQLLRVSPQVYATTTMDDRVNKFGQAYLRGAPLLLHKQLADVVVDAAIDLYQHQGWKLRVYDGLRTVDAAQALYANADPAWLEAGLLAKPGESAHNRALAVDSSLVDKQGREIERFDNLDMVVNNRDYAGDAVSTEQKEARLIKEQAFQRAAIKRGLALAPLQSEYWDDRVPGSEKDLWRVIKSLARCTGQAAPQEKAVNYEQFAAQWQGLNRHGQMTALFGPNAEVPPQEETIVFHEKLPSISSTNLPRPWRQTHQGLQALLGR